MISIIIHKLLKFGCFVVMIISWPLIKQFIKFEGILSQNDSSF